MKEVYMRPNLEIISFEPQKAIATDWDPTWGYEGDIFGDDTSTPETRGFEQQTSG